MAPSPAKEIRENHTGSYSQCGTPGEARQQVVRCNPSSSPPAQGETAEKLPINGLSSSLYFDPVTEATLGYEGITLCLTQDDLPQQSGNQQLTTPRSRRSWMMNHQSRHPGGEGHLGHTGDTDRASHLHGQRWSF